MSSSARLPFVRLPFVCLLLAAAAFPAHAQTTLLVDFGSSPAGNAFGLAGWNTVLLSSNATYVADGPGGIRITSDLDEYTDCMGVRGPARTFARGERIVATWYNASDEVVWFSARVSFTDEDVPDGGTSSGPWYTMRSFDDYRVTYSAAQPHASCRTVFNIASAGVHKTDASAGVVNISLHIQWGASEQKSAFVCDRIELSGDADIAPPSRPTGLNATVLSHSAIALEWSASTDNVGVAEYLVYVDGKEEHIAHGTRDTVRLLNAATAYRFSVSALDRCGNESPRSDPVDAATLAFSGPGTLIAPGAFVYLGAVRFPESCNWGGEALAWNQYGDPGGPADGHPGSLFTSNINTPESGFIGEFDIPAPRISASVDDLGEATLVQNFADIRPLNVNSWPWIDIWHTGLACRGGGSAGAVVLYSSWGFQYQVQDAKTASISACLAGNLAGSTKEGAWFVGSIDLPRDAALNDYLFSLPDAWAASVTGGKALVTGRSRQGGLSGLGPTLHAVAAPEYGAAPVPGFVLPATTLLQYGPVANATGEHFPESFHAYNPADWFRNASWLSAGAQRAVAIGGSKARGHGYYGYTGERMRHDWVIADVPYPDFASTDPDGKGWRGDNEIPMIVLYDPDDLARVAGGAWAPSQPQPYAALRLDPALFYGSPLQLRDAAYDPSTLTLYMTEMAPNLDGRVAMHAWRVIETSDASDAPAASEPRLRLFPNPANASSVLSLSPAGSAARAELFDARGRRMARYDDLPAAITTGGLPAGVYHVVVTAGGRRIASRLVVFH
jgi:hypothetical protein